MKNKIRKKNKGNDEIFRKSIFIYQIFLFKIHKLKNFK